MHDLFLERERGAPLVRERRVRDRPTVVQRADELVVGDEHLVEEHLVELGVAGDLYERPHLDARRGTCRRRGTRCPCASARRRRSGPGRCPSARTARTTSRPSGPRAASRRRRARPASSATRGRNRHRVRRTAGTRSRRRSRIDGSQRAFCSSVPCASSVGPARLMPTRLIGCNARERAYSMLKIATSTGDAPRPPYACRPVDTDPPIGREARLPAPAELDLVGDVLEPRRDLDVVAEPGADLEREGELVGGEREIHGLEVPEAFALVFHERVVQRAARRRRLNGRYASSPRDRTNSSSPPTSVVPELLLHERALHDLVRTSRGRVVHDPHVARAATSGRSRPARRATARTRPDRTSPPRLGVVGQNQPRHHLIAGLVVGHAVDRGQHHARRVPQRLLDRTGGEVLAVDPNPVGRAAREVQVALVVLVTRGRPTSTSRCVSSSRSRRRCCSSPRTDRRPACSRSRRRIRRRSAHARPRRVAPAPFRRRRRRQPARDRARARVRRPACRGRGSPRRRPRSRRTRRSPRGRSVRREAPRPPPVSLRCRTRRAMCSRRRRAARAARAGTRAACRCS